LILLWELLLRTVAAGVAAMVESLAEGKSGD